MYSTISGSSAARSDGVSLTNVAGMTVGASKRSMTSSSAPAASYGEPTWSSAGRFGVLGDTSSRALGYGAINKFPKPTPTLHVFFGKFEVTRKATLLIPSPVHQRGSGSRAAVDEDTVPSGEQQRGGRQGSGRMHDQRAAVPTVVARGWCLSV